MPPPHRPQLPIERAPHLIHQELPDRGSIVFVWCSQCEHWISEESRHKCVLSHEEREERDLLRSTQTRLLADQRKLRDS